MSSRFARCEIWTDYECAGGTRAVIAIPDLVGLTTTRDVTGDEQVELVVPRNSPALPNLLIGRVLRLLRRDVASGSESYDEWRITDRTRVSGLDANTFSYVARPPRFDLVRGDINQVQSTGETSHVFSVTSLTPAQIIDTYVLPALADAGLGYYARGTVDPTLPIATLSFEYFSPLSLLQSLLETTGTELQVRRNGTTGYYIDLLTQIGAGAAMPSFRQTRNLLQNQSIDRTTDQVTRCVPRGGRLPGLSEYHTLARIIVKVTAVSAAGGSLTLTVADPAGAIMPIGFDDQFNDGLVTWSILRQRTGATFPITDTIESTQQLIVTGTPTIAVGEYLELRTDAAQTARIPVGAIAPDGTGSAFGGVMKLPYFSATDASPDTFVVADAGAGSFDWIIQDGQWADLVATFCTQILSDSNVATDATNQRFQFTAAVTSVAVGDLVYYGLSGGMAASPPHGTSFQGTVLWEVTSVDTANKYLYIKPHYANQASKLLPTSSGFRAVVIRAAASQQVLTSTASGNKLTMVATVNAAHLGKIVLLEQWSTGGVLPAYVDEPVAIQAPPGGFGIIPRPLDKATLRGEGNLLANPRFATWSNASNPPDGFSTSGASAEYSQNTNAAFIKFGAKSWNVTLLDSARSKATTVISPLFYVVPVGFTDLNRIAITLSLYLADFSGDTGISFTVESQNMSTTLGVTVGSTVANIFSADYTGANIDAKSKFSAGQWVDITIPAIDLNGSFADRTRCGFGYQLFIAGIDGPSGASPVCRVYLDSIGVYQIAYDPGQGVYVEGSYANALLNAANLQLLANANPTTEYAVKILDLERITGDEPITLGGQLDLRDSALGLVAQPRVVRQVIAELDPANTELTLAKLPPRLTTTLAGGA